MNEIRNPKSDGAGARSVADCTFSAGQPQGDSDFGFRPSFGFRGFGIRIPSLTLCLLMLAVLSLRLDAATNSVADSPSEKSGELLEFLDGSALHGHLRSIDADQGLTWDYADAKQPIAFKPENIAWIRFPDAAKAVTADFEATCEFHFGNGDEFFGNLVSLNENELELQTWFGGKFKTSRDGVRSIRFFPKGAGTIYEGPTGLEGWHLGKNVNSQSWQYRDGAFIGNSPGTLGRELNLPDASRVEFDLSWNAPFNLLFSFYTGVFDGFNYNSSCYMFFLTPGNISLQRINTNTGSSTLGRSDPIPALLTKKKAHLEFRANKQESFLEVLVDGKSANQWKDTAGWVGKGSGILFYTQTDGAGVTISNIKVSEWDGRPGAEVSTNAARAEDELYLVNRDKVSGKVTALREGKFKFMVASNSLEIPQQRVTQIFFANSVPKVEARNPWEIQASVTGGGAISFALEKWSREKVSGQNINFGKISLHSLLIRQMQFNPGKARASESEVANDILWEIDEK